MKKAILPAVISALLATSAHAANLYDADGTSVALSGEVDGLYYAADDGSSTSNSVSSWANAQLDISTEISNGVTGMASFEIEATDGSEVKVDDAWVGFAGDFGTVKIGETGSSFGIMEKAELVNEGDEYSYVYTDAEGTGNSIRYEKTIGAIALSANYFIDETKTSAVSTSVTNTDGDDVKVETTDTEDDSIEGFAVSADYAVDAFTIGVAYIDSGNDATGYGVSASYEADALYLAATYTMNTQNSDSDYDFYTAAVSASYAFGDVASLYGSYQVNDGDNTDLTNWYVGISKDITANIYAFVEYNATDVDDTDTSLATAGVYYAF